MQRKRLEWKLKRRSIQLGDRTLIMAILNVTPDSFSDGGEYTDPDRAFARAMELEEQGADIIDIGAESTRPGAQPISEAEELRRLVPVLKRLRDRLSVPISVDTYKAAVAEKAIEHGAEIINDPSGFTFDPNLARVVTNHDAGLVLNHMRGTPETWARLAPLPDPAGSVARELDAAANRARHAGLARERIVVDPGLGFGKRKEQNVELLARLPVIGQLGFGVLVGPSRKSFLARPDEGQTRSATAAAVAAAILGGAHIVRVHDVPEMIVAAQVADAVLEAMPDTEAGAADGHAQRPQTEVVWVRDSRPATLTAPAQERRPIVPRLADAQPSPAAPVEPVPTAPVEPVPEATAEPVLEATVGPVPEATVEPVLEATTETPEATGDAPQMPAVQPPASDAVAVSTAGEPARKPPMGGDRPVRRPGSEPFKRGPRKERPEGEGFKKGPSKGPWERPEGEGFKKGPSKGPWERPQGEGFKKGPSKGPFDRPQGEGFRKGPSKGPWERPEGEGFRKGPSKGPWERPEGEGFRKGPSKGPWERPEGEGFRKGPSKGPLDRPQGEGFRKGPPSKGPWERPQGEGFKKGPRKGPFDRPQGEGFRKGPPKGPWSRPEGEGFEKGPRKGPWERPEGKPFDRSRPSEAGESSSRPRGPRPSGGPRPGGSGPRPNGGPRPGGSGPRTGEGRPRGPFKGPKSGPGGKGGGKPFKPRGPRS
jgi:dihydropteroate synthase